MQQNVRMAFHHSGHQREAREVDRFGVGGIDPGRWAGGLDALAAYAHRPAFLHGLAIEDPRRPKHRDCPGIGAPPALRGRLADAEEKKNCNCAVPTSHGAYDKLHGTGCQLPAVEARPAA